MFSKHRSQKGTNLYINEHLTRDRASLFKYGRVLKRAKHISNCWTSNGQLIAKDTVGGIYNINQRHQLDDIAISEEEGERLRADAEYNFQPPLDVNMQSVEETEDEDDVD